MKTGGLHFAVVFCFALFLPGTEAQLGSRAVSRVGRPGPGLSSARQDLSALRGLLCAAICWSQLIIAAIVVGPSCLNQPCPSI